MKRIITCLKPSFGLCLFLAANSWKRSLAFVVPSKNSFHHTFIHHSNNSYSTTTSTLLSAKPKRGTVVDSYQTVSVICANCQTRLFRYKKKNGTKSNLIKCYVERIVEDAYNILQQGNDEYQCPQCETNFARATVIRGLPALKLVGGKTRMTKK